MLTAGPGKKVGIYVAEGQQYHGSTAYAAILDFLFFHGVSGATVTRGIAGFGADHRLQTATLVDLAVRLPVKIEFIETAEKVDELLPKLQAMAGTGLIEMHDTTIVKPAERKRKQTELIDESSAKGSYNNPVTIDLPRNDNPSPAQNYIQDSPISSSLARLAPYERIHFRNWKNNSANTA